MALCHVFALVLYLLSLTLFLCLCLLLSVPLFQSSNGRYLTVDHTHLLSAKNENGGPESIFELHRFRVASVAQAATTTPSSSAAAASHALAYRYAIRSPLGRFLNIDESLELAIKEKGAKDLGPKCDRVECGEREKGFELIPLNAGRTNKDIVDDGTLRVALRTPDEFFLGVDPSDPKVKLLRNPTANPNLPPCAPSRPGTAMARPSPNTTPSTENTFIPTTAEIFQITWLDDRSPFTLHGRHLIRTAHQLLWCVEPSGALVANRLESSLWESILIEPVNRRQVTFTSYHKGVMRFDGVGRRRVSFTGQSNRIATVTAVVNEYDRDQAGSVVAATPVGVSVSPVAPPETLFDVIEVDKERREYAFRAANGLYLCAQGTHIITATSSIIGPWERFTLTPCA